MKAKFFKDGIIVIIVIIIMYIVCIINVRALCCVPSRLVLTSSCYYV